MNIAGHSPSSDGAAILEHDACCPALLDDYLPDGSIDLDLHAALAGGVRHSLGDRPHAANGMAPSALLAVHLAKDVVQQDIGGVGRVGAGKGADDGVEAEGR